MNPAQAIYDIIIGQLATSTTSKYEFADQSLLSDIFHGRWVPLPYVYNALKTLRWEGVHDCIWRDESVKNVHYILNPKPWEEGGRRCNGEVGLSQDPTHIWWWELNEMRLEDEKARGVIDRF